MPIQLQAAALSDTGRQREMNEDCVYQKVVAASDENAMGLFIVADGMGGHLGGEVASYWAVETIKDSLNDLFAPRDPRGTVHLNPSEMGNQRATNRLDRDNLVYRVEAAVRRANDVVRDYARQRPGEASDAGTTVSLALIRGERALVANVGDSRTYLLREGQLRQISTDHSLVQRLIEAGQVRPDELYTHPQRSLIYRSLGNKDSVEVDTFALKLSPGDLLLLCSDGLWEMLHSPGKIAAIIRESPSLEAACQRLVAAANEAGGEDNIGVVVVRVS
jgi:serine/threonine protein phosphatase PrpC